MADGPDDGLAERLLGELLDGALRVRGALLVAQGELDGQPGDDQVDQPVGDQADPGRVVEPLALMCLPARLLGLGADAAHAPASLSPELDTRRGRESCGQERSASALSMARWKVG